MPLNNDGSVANTSRMTSIGPSQKQRSHEPISRSSTPLHRSKETGTTYESTVNPMSRSYNPLGARDVSASQAQDRSRAAGLKMEVRNTIRKQAGNTNSDSQTTKGGFIARVKSPERGRLVTQQKSQIDAHTRFDDTTMDLGLDDDSSMQENENQTMVFRGNAAQSLQLLGKDDYEQNAFYRTSNFVSNAFELDPDWEEDVRKERALQAQEQGFQDDDELSEHYSHDVRYSDEAALGQNEDAVDTPSRGHIPQPARIARTLQSKTVSFDPLNIEGGEAQRDDSPELTIPQSDSMAGPKPNPNNKPSTDKPDMAVFSNVLGSPERTVRRPSTGSLPTQKKISSIKGKLPQVSTVEAPCASDDLTSPEVDSPPVRPATSPKIVEDKQNRLKRRREHDIDYDPSRLKDMTYEDLRKETFGTDPKDLTQNAAFNNHGNAMALSQRLNNLNKMSETDQKNMFRNQNDQEWAQTGSWFIDKFQEDLKRLMDVRTERRKISMRYEDEIRRRQKDVEWCSANVEDELNGLKRGGGELIKGREASSRRGTPTKK